MLPSNLFRRPLHRSRRSTATVRPTPAVASAPVFGLLALLLLGGLTPLSGAQAATLGLTVTDVPSNVHSVHLLKGTMAITCLPVTPGRDTDARQQVGTPASVGYRAVWFLDGACQKGAGDSSFLTPAAINASRSGVVRFALRATREG